jgi:hypothetical protein
VQVTLSNGATGSAKVLGADPNADLAVLKIDGTNLPTGKLGTSDDVGVGDPQRRVRHLAGRPRHRGPPAGGQQMTVTDEIGQRPASNG